MQEVRLWEVVNDDSLREISASQIAFEVRLEEWLAKDISVLDPNLLVIGRQVRTDFGGYIDLLCMDNQGDVVVVELKRGQIPPRDTTQTKERSAAQALDYASWVKDRSHEEITSIAREYIQRVHSCSLEDAFEQSFEEKLPEEFNGRHRSLIVAESIDAATERIIRYLSDMNVPINVATVQHFTDSDDRKFLAQVYLIEPEEAETKPPPGTRRRQTLAGLEKLAKRHGLGELYSQVRAGVRGILKPSAYPDRNFYRYKRKDGGHRTALIVWAIPYREYGGLEFTVHVTRLKKLFGIDMDTVREWLPSNARQRSLSGWAGSSEEEKRHAEGFNGAFKNGDEVNKFLDGLRTAVEASTTT